MTNKRRELGWIEALVHNLIPSTVVSTPQDHVPVVVETSRKIWIGSGDSGFPNDSGDNTMLSDCNS